MRAHERSLLLVAIAACALLSACAMPSGRTAAVTTRDAEGFTIREKVSVGSSVRVAAAKANSSVPVSASKARRAPSRRRPRASSASTPS